jgi:hypothetical protein
MEELTAALAELADAVRRIKFLEADNKDLRLLLQNTRSNEEANAAPAATMSIIAPQALTTPPRTTTTHSRTSSTSTPIANDQGFSTVTGKRPRSKGNSPSLASHKVTVSAQATPSIQTKNPFNALDQENSSESDQMSVETTDEKAGAAEATAPAMVKQTRNSVRTLPTRVAPSSPTLLPNG